jgi:hypothetical protein
MLLDAGFVAAVLEGFERTLDEVVGRVASPELRADLLYCKPGLTTQSFDRTAGRELRAKRRERWAWRSQTRKSEVTAMIAYHGGPFSELTIATEIWRKHHAMISFARPEQLGIAAEYASSFVLDNGAFSLWRAGQRRPAWDSYYR